jgi:hypothetical protein
VPVFCGIDWAEDHYDVAIVDDTGAVLLRRRIVDDALGYQLLVEVLAEHGDASAARSGAPPPSTRPAQVGGESASRSERRTVDRTPRRRVWSALRGRALPLTRPPGRADFNGCL